MTDASIGPIEMERDLHQAIVDKAVAQGKLEMASDVLHDIGNAVVGFGSYLTRIRRSLEQTHPENLLNLSGFFADQQTAIGNAIGAAKAGAVVSMLRCIVESQTASRAEIQRSISEQLNIITHIQEILNIQRQYVAGRELKEKTAVNLRSLISDCLAMLFASLDKRNIAVNMAITAESPIIQGDRTRLMQVIMNIFKNSIEAIDKAASDKTISIRLYEEGGFLILQVKDTGNGFDAATAALIFGRGFTTKSSGTGLGLHNCKTILESHAGLISITSEGPGKGALTMIQFKI